MKVLHKILSQVCRNVDISTSRFTFSFRETYPRMYIIHNANTWHKCKVFYYRTAKALSFRVIVAMQDLEFLQNLSALDTVSLHLIEISYGNRSDHKPNLTTFAKHQYLSRVIGNECQKKFGDTLARSSHICIDLYRLKRKIAAIH